MEVDILRKNRNLSELKEKLKKGVVSYFSFTQEEVDDLVELFRIDIEEDKKEIEKIREKIIIEKEKLKNNL